MELLHTSTYAMSPSVTIIGTKGGDSKVSDEPETKKSTDKKKTKTKKSDE